MQDTCQQTALAQWMAASLERWFRHSARQLPWRDNYEPYRVWVAEIMLQQTTVQACIRHFQRFVARFPTLRSLAEASEEDVLAAWEGLGYYTRARNLLKCARKVVTDFGGVFPQDSVELRRLPGVGPYTAGAISAIAYEKASAMVDANVRRVLGRVLGLAVDARNAEKRVFDLSLEVSQAGPPRVVNQALMEVGALVCLTGRLSCEVCPLRGRCVAAGSGQYERYGSASRKTVASRVTEVCALAHREGMWLVARPADGRWRGMWEFPRVRMENGEDSVVTATSMLARRYGVRSAEPRMLGQIRHRVTVYDITLCVVMCSIVGPLPEEVRDCRLVTREQVRSLPLPSPMRRIAQAWISGDEGAPG